jgi:uncharacterized membrane protein YqhA
MIERMFEKFLWNSRFIVLVAVIASLVTAIAMFYIATVDVWVLVSHLGDYISPDLNGDARREFRAESVAHVVEVIDGYLLATVLFIFSLGLYELFISKIDEAESGEHDHSKVLAVKSLDDLKSKLARVVLMILIVKFFEHAVNMEFHGPLDLLALAGGISLIALALYLSKSDDH